MKPNLKQWQWCHSFLNPFFVKRHSLHIAVPTVLIVSFTRQIACWCPPQVRLKVQSNSIRSANHLSATVSSMTFGFPTSMFPSTKVESGTDSLDLENSDTQTNNIIWTSWTSPCTLAQTAEWDFLTLELEGISLRRGGIIKVRICVKKNLGTSS